jgi:uncharacterized protein YjbJ (UPF0337 family)
MNHIERDRRLNDHANAGLRDEVGGHVENVGGRIEQAAGALTGSRRHEARGMFARVRGAVRAFFGGARRRAARDRAVRHA